MTTFATCYLYLLELNDHILVYNRGIHQHAIKSEKDLNAYSYLCSETCLFLHCFLCCGRHRQSKMLPSVTKDNVLLLVNSCWQALKAGHASHFSNLE